MNKKYDFKFDFICIHDTSNQWFCKKCQKAHGKLYIDNLTKLKYCPICVPNEIKEKATHMNQNQELI